MTIRICIVVRKKWILAIIIFFIIFLKFAFKNEPKKSFQSNEKLSILTDCKTPENENFTTVLTCYFAFKSKFSSTQYRKWMINMLTSVSAPLVVFTDNASKEYISNIRNKTKYHTKFYIYQDIWKIMAGLEFERKMNYKDKYIHRQFDLDPENNVHNPNLYAVWNLKSYMTNKIANLNPFNSSFFIYTDIGAFREEIIPDWPDNGFISQLSCILDNRILFGQIEEYFYDLSDSTDSFITKDLIEGGFFAGSKIAIRNFKETFYKLHDELMDRNIFVGKDQKMMNLYAFKTNRDQVVRIRTWNLKCPKYDEWFFYQKFLAQKKYYNCSEDKYSLLINL